MKKQPSVKKDIIEYLKESKKYILSILILFILSALIGFINAENLQEVGNLLRDIIDKTENLSGLELIVFIFFNNAFSSLIGLVLGIFLGIFPLIITITNGIVLGYVMNRTIAVVGVFQLWRLLPHGIIELTAVFISLGLGLRLGVEINRNYRAINKKNKALKTLGTTSLILGLIGIGIIRFAVDSIIASQSKDISAYLNSLIIIILGILIIIPFVILFFYTDKKMREFIVINIKSSLKIFVKIIVPMLIIAAIIEGLLIALV
ncbi:MAG: stage II sporulation protein M [Nanoarchaeota archaeon]|nr:stage II sporulation protein M [Nanoarchaeota archaeon]